MRILATLLIGGAQSIQWAVAFVRVMEVLTDVRRSNSLWNRSIIVAGGMSLHHRSRRQGSSGAKYPWRRNARVFLHQSRDKLPPGALGGVGGASTAVVGCAMVLFRRVATLAKRRR